MADRTPDRQPSTASRHSSLRRSNPDIFSDDFALDSIVVSDGFRPSMNRDDAVASTPACSTAPTTAPRRSIALQSQAEQSPKSVKRKQLPHGISSGSSTSSRNDGAPILHPQRTVSMASMSEMSEATSSHQRPSSIISGYSMPRRESVYRGATGPSHPYAMYPQDTTLNRTSTTSSVRPLDRSYGGTNGPMHPYGMYTQNTVPEGEISMGNNTAPIAPVGFPGRSQQYTRRLGPDGEEADDIIGPDGHAEQLPPYTRYPDAIVTKENPAQGDPEGQVSPQSPLQPTPSQGSSDEVQSPDDERAHINPQPTGGAAPVNHRTIVKERWASNGKKWTCCGVVVPRWAVVVMVVLALLLAAILGAVVGRLVSDKKNHQGNNSPYPNAPPAAEVTLPRTVTVTAMPPDATILSTAPPNLPTLPTGTFGIALTSPKVNNACLVVPGQGPAWDCARDGFIGLNVTPVDYGSTQVSVFTLMPDLPYFYGAQAPVLQSLSSLQLVIDRYNPEEGPAYFFQQTYDKLVILPQTSLSPTGSKRSLGEIMEEATLEERGSIVNRTPALPGQKPWFCYWNNTILEGFIYVTQNTSDPSQNTTAIVNSVISVATPAPSSSPSSSSGKVESKRDATWPSFVPSPYPKCTKIEERRDLNTAVTPYCQQMQVLDNHHVNPVANPNGGEPPIVNLKELESSMLVRSVGSRSRKRDWVNSSCTCEWKSA